MNQIFLVTAGLALSIMLWGLGRSPRKLFSQKANFKGQLSQSNTSLVGSNQFLGDPGFACIHQGESEFQAPKTIQEKQQLKNKLFKAINSDPANRLEAVTSAGLWGDKSVLPILRRGLKDSDSLVVSAAAAAITKYRESGPNNHDKNQINDRPPRNVARMR